MDLPKNEKIIFIQVNERTTERGPFFTYKTQGLERYEVIGLLTLAIEELKQDCLNDTEKRFPEQSSE